MGGMYCVLIHLNSESRCAWGFPSVSCWFIRSVSLPFRQCIRRRSQALPTTDGIKFTYSFRDLSVTWALRWRNGLVPHFCRQHGWNVGLTRPSTFGHRVMHTRDGMVRCNQVSIHTLTRKIEEGALHCMTLHVVVPLKQTQRFLKDWRYLLRICLEANC
jgi:hypothetical protein